MSRATNRPSQLLLLLPETGNVITDENNVVIREDTPSDTITYIKIRITTTKTNTPDEYHGDKRKLKTFII